MSDPTRLPALDDPRRIFDFTGRLGVVTGGAGKMGRQFARVLARAGADLVLADVNEAAVTEAAGDVAKETGRDVEGVACDASDEAAVARLFERAKARKPRIDFFVHNVMAKPPGYYRPLDKYTPETWRAVVDGNLASAFLCAREAARAMDGGSIVLTASTYALVGPDPRIYDGVPNPYGGSDPLGLPAAYSASKAGIVGLARHLAAEWGPRGVRVNVLVPGGVQDGHDPRFVEAYERRTPLGRMAAWTDYNGAILFLASDASRYMTGASLIVDGGWTAW